MLIAKTIAQLRNELIPQKKQQKIGFVPTMGGLHQGHFSLINDAIKENDMVVVSIFVNPLQFSPKEDLDRYPRQLEKDCQICQELGVNIVFTPTVEEMGINKVGEDSTTTTIVIPPQTMTSVLCGRDRKIFFQGIATILTKLFNIVEPTNAYFGQKDAQQLAIVRRLVKDLNIPVNIKACPIVREDSGLACSSRNQYLTSDEKEKAGILYASLQGAKQAFIKGEKQVTKLIEIVRKKLGSCEGIKIQYVEIVHPQTMIPLEVIEDSGLLAIACYLGKTRLIDNLILQDRKPIIAIDGPAGAGKSTVTRQIAEILGLNFLDTGAMYRAVTWLVMDLGLSLDDENAIENLVSKAKIELIFDEKSEISPVVKVNDIDVTKAIRSEKVTTNVSKIAAMAPVRLFLVKQQQEWGKKGGIVAEGRDIGTNVFPHAELKIFLTASVSERAKRRFKDLESRGELNLDLQGIQDSIEKRDAIDSNRSIAPLKKAPDAIELITDGLTIEEVIQKIIGLYKDKIRTS